MTTATAMFSTDKSAETSGVWIDYGAFRVRIARAGGSNKRFAKTLKRLTEPHRRAIDTKVLPDEVSDGLLRQAYAQAIVLEWDMPDPEWDGEGDMEDHRLPLFPFDEGENLPFTLENVERVLLELPEFFKDIQRGSAELDLFRTAALEDAAGN